MPYDMCSNIKIILWRQICQKQLSFIRGFAHKLQQSVVGVRNYEEDGANSKLRIQPASVSSDVKSCSQTRVDKVDGPEQLCCPP